MKIKINKKTPSKVNLLEGVHIESVLYQSPDVTVKDLIRPKSKKKLVKIIAIDSFQSDKIIQFYPPVIDKDERKFVNHLRTRVSRGKSVSIGDIIEVA